MVKGDTERMLDMALDDLPKGTSNGNFGGGQMRRQGASSIGKWSRGGMSSASSSRIRGLANNRPISRGGGGNYNPLSRDMNTGGARWGKDRSAGHIARQRPSRRRMAPSSRVSSSPATSRVQRRARISTKGSIKITGLQADVSSDCVKEIFEERIGVVMQAFVLYDREGKSTGTAKVTFGKISEARQAIERLDKSLVDGKEIRIKMDNDDEFEEQIVVKTSPRRAPTRAAPARGRAFPSPTSYGVNQQRGRGFSGRMASSTMSRRGATSTISDLPPDIPNPLGRDNDLQLDRDFGGNRGGGSFRGRGRGGFRGRGGRGRGGFRGRAGGFGGSTRSDNFTEADLDKELDDYNNS